jgi:hypothetical protein
MIILISGRLGSGKSRLAEELTKSIPNSCIVKFADPLYAIHESVRETLKSYDSDFKGINRDLLQDLGIWGRKQDEKFWVNIARKRVDKILKEHPDATVIADDLRFPNEFMAFADAFTIRLKASEECRVRRAQKLGNLNHVSETAMDAFSDNMFSLILDTEHDSIEENVSKCLSAIQKFAASGL